MFAADRKAYVGDGQNWLWSLWERHFKPFGFVPILDFIHALTYTHPRNCLRVGYFISPCECKTTTDYVAQLFIGFGIRQPIFNTQIRDTLKVS